MGAIDSPTLTPVRLAPPAIPAALRLSMAVGWNQTADDWALLLDHGNVTGVFAEGELVATTATLPYDRLGYVAMVIVAPGHRKQGIAGRLLSEAVSGLVTRHVTPMLDATPAGATVYRRLGFTDVCRLRRWEGFAVPQTGEALPDIRDATSDDAKLLAALDEAAFGATRQFLIRDFLRRQGTRALILNDAFVMRRRGARADQIGPLVAPDSAIAARLLDAALALRPGPVFVDLFDCWGELADSLQRRGFSVQRPFTRMALGADVPRGDPARLFVAAGPEFG